MSTTIVIYGGSGKEGERKKRALEREALRTTKRGSVSEMVWSLFERFGSDELKRDLKDAERRGGK